MCELIENVPLTKIEKNESGSPWLENETIVPKWFFETDTSSQFSDCAYRQQRRSRTSIYNVYENALWKPTPWYMQLWKRIKLFLYFLTGPKFICSIFGIFSLSFIVLLAMLKFKFCSNQPSLDSLREVHIIKWGASSRWSFGLIPA